MTRKFAFLNNRILLVGEKKFYVNSRHLSKESEFFNGLFNSNFMEKEQKEIELKEVAASDFKDFLRVLNDPKSLVSEDTLASCLALSLRFLCPYVLHKCIKFLENIENFRKIKAKDLFALSDGCDEIKRLVETQLITTIENHENSEHDELKDCFELSVETGMDKLNSAVRATMLNAVERDDTDFLDRLFGSSVDADSNVSSIAELILIDLFDQESNKNIGFRKYFHFSKVYKLEMLESVVYGFIEAKTLSYEGIEEIGVILNVNGELLNYKVQHMVATILVTNFDKINHDAPTLRILLNMAKHYGFAVIEDEINTFLENDFVTNHHFKYIQLVVDLDMEDLKNLMSRFLREYNAADLPIEDRHTLFFSTPEVKDFAFRHILNL